MNSHPQCHAAVLKVGKEVVCYLAAALVEELDDGAMGGSLSQTLNVHLVASLAVPVLPWANIEFLAEKNNAAEPTDLLHHGCIIKE